MTPCPSVRRAGALLAGALHVAAGAQPLPPPPMAQRAQPAQTTLYLELVVNERSSGQIVPVLVRSGRFFVEASVLDALYVRSGRPAGELVAIDQIPGVTATYDSAAQRLKLAVPADWLPTQEIGPRPESAFVAMSSEGALLNYDVYANKPDRGHANVSVWSEQRLFGEWGSLSNTGIYRPGTGAADPGYMRYDTRWSRSDTEKVRTTSVGDLIAAPLSWGSAVRLGGVQFARNFAVRPDLITYPLPRFSGQAGVPSAVDLFINGYKAGSENVQPGPFTLNTVPYVNGAGEAMVVTTDALGRQVVTTVPFYVANTLLRQGTTDYSVSAGALRRGYGVRNFQYGPMAASAAGRIGLSDSFTLEARAETARALALAGVGGVQALGRWGVVNASLSQARVRERSGQQLNLGYQYTASRFGMAVQRTWRARGYGDLSTYDTPDARPSRRVTQFNGSLSLGEAGSFALAYFDIVAADAQRTRLLSGSYSRALSGTTFLSVAANKSVGGRAFGVQAQLTFALGARGMLGIAHARERDGPSRSQVNYSENPPTEGGLGWNLAYAGDGGRNDYHQASLVWRARAAQLQGGVYGQGGSRSSWLNATGSVVRMDGGWFAANRINDAFIVVSASGIPGVPIRYENQLLGRTDAAGRLLVPNVPGFYPARVEVEPLDLPDHLQITQPQQRLAVRSGTGALLQFEITTTVAARITLVDESGRPLTVGLPVQHVQSGRSGVVGWDGLVYFEGLQAQNDLLVRAPGNRSCRVRFAADAQPQVLRIGPLVCRLATDTQATDAGPLGGDVFITLRSHHATTP